MNMYTQMLVTVDTKDVRFHTHSYPHPHPSWSYRALVINCMVRVLGIELRHSGIEPALQLRFYFLKKYVYMCGRGCWNT